MFRFEKTFVSQQNEVSLEGDRFVDELGSVQLVVMSMMTHFALTLSLSPYRALQRQCGTFDLSCLSAAVQVELRVEISPLRRKFSKMTHATS